MDKLKGETEEQKAIFREKLRQQEKEKILKEKKEKAENLKKIRAQVEDEKKKRVEKNSKKDDMKEEPSIKVVKTEKNSETHQVKKEVKKEKVVKEEPKLVEKKEHTECLLQIRLFDGSTVKEKFKADAFLEDVALFIIQTTKKEVHYGDFTIVTPFPKKEYTSSDFNKVSLKDAQLLPKGTITVQKLESKGLIKKGEGQIEQNHDNPDDPEEGPQILPFPGPGIGYKPKPIPKPLNEPEPIEDDTFETNSKLLCKLWLLSNEECPEGSDILVYRPSDFQFETVKNDRKAFCFMDDGSYSETEVVEGVKNTVTGIWTLKKNGTELTIKIGNSTKKVEIATITDEVLILS